MADVSNADDDSFLRDYDDGGGPPFAIGDLVAPDPAVLAEDDPSASRRGRVLELRRTDHGWKILVEWVIGDPQWDPANRLVAARSSPGGVNE
jgi:hypothetical protein